MEKFPAWSVFPNESIPCNAQEAGSRHDRTRLHVAPMLLSRRMLWQTSRRLQMQQVSHETYVVSLCDALSKIDSAGETLPQGLYKYATELLMYRGCADA
jgi:hypothetical protein